MNFSRYRSFATPNAAWSRSHINRVSSATGKSRYTWNKSSKTLPSKRQPVVGNRVWTAKKSDSESFRPKNRVWIANETEPKKENKIKTKLPPPPPPPPVSHNRVWKKLPNPNDDKKKEKVAQVSSSPSSVSIEEKEPKTPPITRQRRRNSTEYKTKYALKRRRSTCQIMTSSSPLSKLSRYKLVKIPVVTSSRQSGGSSALVQKTRHKIIRKRSPSSFSFSPSSSTTNNRVYFAKKFKLIRHHGEVGGRTTPMNPAACTSVITTTNGHDRVSTPNTIRKVSRYKLMKIKTSAQDKGSLQRYKQLIRKSPFKLIKSRTMDQRRHAAAANRVLRRSLTLVRTSKLKSDARRYCMFYNRFGKCRRGNECPYIHDPEKIAVCTRFLRGTCDKTDGSCLFSHKINRDKMPVCSFFLRGSCANEKCPYSHVRVSQTASICDDFLRGFCPAGSNCLNKHVLECPTFSARGQCPNGASCKLAHRKKRKRTDDNDDVVVKRRRKSSSVRTPAVFKRRKRKKESVEDDDSHGSPRPMTATGAAAVPSIKPYFLEN